MQQRESQPPRLFPPSPSITEMPHILCLVWWRGSRSVHCLYSLDHGVPDLSLPGQDTKAGYQAAISSGFKHTGLPDVGHGPTLTALLSSFSRQHPKRLRVLPQWDLSLVLMALTRAPLEPLQLAAPKFLAWKAFFLTLLASGARRGELHVITA